jgi:hypothetical protein
MTLPCEAQLVKRALVTWLLLAVVRVSPLLGQAQGDTLASIAGTVRSSINGLPVNGVMVAVQGARAFGVSDSSGAFTIAELPSGRQTLRIRYGDSLSYEQEVTLKRGKTLTLSVLLDVTAVELSPIVVVAQTLRADRSLVGFYDRKKWGFGRYYTPADLDRRRGLLPRELLSEAGVLERCRIGGCVPYVLDAGRPCVLSVFLDGVRTASDYLDLVHLDELAAVEVYKHGIEVPVEFQRVTGRSCGAVLLWSRY